MGDFQTKQVFVSLSGKKILENISLVLHKGTITAIIGPNGSGKSTLLKTLAKNLLPSGGCVYFSGTDLRSLSGKELARKLAVLYQSPKAPADITVQDLVEYGRFPHLNWWKGKTNEDRELVLWAMRQTGLSEYAARPVVTLSGGEQQRAWIAMALAQKPQTLVLDEPTAYLDIAHQLEIMELLKRLNRENGLSVVMVLHDLNHAAQYADTVVALSKGQVAAVGSPAEVITAKLLREVFEVEVDFWLDADKKPVFIARSLIKRRE